MKASEYIEEEHFPYNTWSIDMIERFDRKFISKDEIIELIEKAKILNETERDSMSTLAHNQLLQELIKEIERFI